MIVPPFLQSLLEPWLLFLAEDPMLRMLQACMLVTGALMIFFVFFATRDILLRTNSFFYMFLCIVLVAILPVVGFLIYLLIRPPRTLKERKIEEMLLSLTEKKKPGVAATLTKKAKAATAAKKKAK